MSDTRPIDNLRTALETWGAVNPGGSSLEIMKARRGFLHTAVTNLMNGGRRRGTRLARLGGQARRPVQDGPR